MKNKWLGNFQELYSDTLQKSEVFGLFLCKGKIFEIKGSPQETNVNVHFHATLGNINKLNDSVYGVIRTETMSKHTELRISSHEKPLLAGKTKKAALDFAQLF